MAGHHHDRPDLDQRKAQLPLLISGTLPDSAPFIPYEARLQMKNFIGPSHARLQSGTLPNGYTISVDEETQEIVIAWPAWEPVAQPVFNGNFEMGDIGWQKGAGWQVNYQPADVRITGNWAGVFRGTGQSPILCEPQPCSPGAGFPFSAVFDQGPSNKKNVDCYAVVVFYDISGQPIGPPVLGSKVHDQSNTTRHTSSGNATPPAGTAKASTGALVVRRKYDRPVSVDDVQWGLAGSGVGAAEDSVYPITIIGSDSTGRSAIWSGIVTVSSSAPLQPYDVEVMNSGPVLYWKGNDSAFVGGFNYPRILDSSGNGIFANISGGVSLQQGALRPGGQSVRHTMTGSSWAWSEENGAPFQLLNIANTGEVSVEIIIEIPSIGNLGTSNPAILRKRRDASTTGAQDYGLNFFTDVPSNLIGVSGQYATHLSGVTVSTPVSPVGRIVHLVNTVETIPGGVRQRLFIDGVEVDVVDAFIAGPPYLSDSNYVLEIGGSDFPASWSFASRWSDAAVYARTLTPAEIARHAQAAGFMPAP